MKKKKGLILNKCEIEGCNVSECLELHHIIERTEINTSNHTYNIAILCANHHSFIHAGLLKIIGVYPSTRLPNGRTLIYELCGKKNIDIDVPMIDFKVKEYNI